MRLRGKKEGEGELPVESALSVKELQQERSGSFAVNLDRGHRGDSASCGHWTEL